MVAEMTVCSSARTTDEYLTALAQLVKNEVRDVSELNALLEIIADVFAADCVSISICLNQADRLVSCYPTKKISLPDLHVLNSCVLEKHDLLFIRDIASDTQWSHTANIIGHTPLTRYVGIPITLSDIPVGVLGIFNPASAVTKNEFSRLRLFALSIEGMLLANVHSYQTEQTKLKLEQQQKICDREARLLHEVEDISGVGAWEYDVNEQQLFWTKKTREIHGVDSSYVPDLESANTFYPVEYRHVIDEKIQHAIKTHSNWNYELPFTRSDGKELWVNISGRTIYKNGSLCRLIGGFENVSDRRKKDSQLRESERLQSEKSNELSTIITNMTQGVAVFGSDFKLKYWNQQYVDILPRDPVRMQLGTSFREILEDVLAQDYSDHAADDIFQQMEKYFRHNETMQITYTLANRRIVSSLYSPLPEGGWVTTVEDVTEREEAAKKITYAAHHDTLTELANRTLFNTTLNEALHEVKFEASRTQYVLMLLDLDGFKSVNDTYGHIIGDEILKHVSSRLLNSVREDDLVARFGGDEFAILLSGSTHMLGCAERVAQDILISIQQPYRIDDLRIEIGISIGISMVRHQDSTLSDVIHRSDTALYNVKRNGKNDYLIYSEEQTI